MNLVKQCTKRFRCRWKGLIVQVNVNSNAVAQQSER